MLDYRETTLPNGLRLITVPMKGISSVAVLLGVGSGSRDEAASKAGLSHFLEHMASKGTKKRPTSFEVASVIDSVGGEQNAGTSKEFTEYWAKVASPHIERAFDFLADNLKNSLFALEEIEKERRVIIEEINMYEDTPMHRIMDIFELLLYGNNALGRDIAGDKETIAQIKRQDFFSHLKNLYQSQDMVVVVAGKFWPRKVRKLTQLYFGDLKKGRSAKKKRLKFSQGKPRVRLMTKKTDQAHFCLGVHGVNYTHPDRFVVSVLASTLGYSRTSRLYRRIREERGLAYYVHAFPEFYSDTGAVYAQAGVGLTKIGEAIKLVREEFLKISREQVGAPELKRAKDYIKGRFILALEDSFSVASRYAIQAVVEGKLRKPEEVLTLIDKVTADDVLRIAKRLLKPQKMNLAIIGPYRDQTKFEKLL